MMISNIFRLKLRIRENLQSRFSLNIDNRREVLPYLRRVRLNKYS